MRGAACPPEGAMRSAPLTPPPPSRRSPTVGARECVAETLGIDGTPTVARSSVRKRLVDCGPRRQRIDRGGRRSR
jgi:hypothetical protein